MDYEFEHPLRFYQEQDPFAWIGFTLIKALLYDLGAFFSDAFKGKRSKHFDGICNLSELHLNSKTIEMLSSPGYQAYRHE